MLKNASLLAIVAVHTAENEPSKGDVGTKSAGGDEGDRGEARGDPGGVTVPSIQQNFATS